ncbi:MAG: 16S rRNA (cytosine(967)-C(5))-methyltransferase RsmB [Rhodoferax sp.]
MSAGHSAPLWQTLQHTARVLAATDAGVSGTQALDQVEPSLRAGVQALAFLAWRDLGRVQVLARLLVPRRPGPWTQALLHAALALLGDAQSQRSDYTVVDQAVEAAKRQRNQQRYAALLNAALRRYLREREALEQQACSDGLARWNFPPWWVRRLRQDHPQHWQDILAQSNRAAPLTLRVNRRRTDVAAYLERLRAQGIQAWAQDGSAVVLRRPMDVRTLPGFLEGEVSVQDAAAQRAAPLVLQGLGSAGPRLRLLDACAAPGGKTGHLAECVDADILALEVDAQRAVRIEDNLRRLGLQAQVRVASALEPQAWWDGQPFDAIVLDAPCSASGIVRRHPDVRWLRRDSDIDQLAQVQRQMLDVLWPLVRSGGRLLLCTCSVFAAEGREQAQAFLRRHSDALSLPAPGHMLPQSAGEGALLADNAPQDHDGFYYALFEKLPAPAQA